MRIPSIVPRLTRRTIVITAACLVAAGAFMMIASGRMADDLRRAYRAQFGTEILDRHGAPVVRTANAKGHYASLQKPLPPGFEELLLEKEDGLFRYHLGFNPYSWARGSWKMIVSGRTGGTSTITEQLVKMLLGHEAERSVRHKLSELAYAVALELYASKDEILGMYAASVYLGNQVQGFDEASRLYFDRPLEALAPDEEVQLLAALSSPTALNPWRARNERAAEDLAARLSVATSGLSSVADRVYKFTPDAAFELQSLGLTCENSCTLTIDQDLTRVLRGILAQHIARGASKNIRNGAIVVIAEPAHELIAIVGSPDPAGHTDGAGMNMAIAPRPIGSTAKPFIFLEAFRRGARPYTLIEDREFRYAMGDGFSIYPKNYDGTYHGTVTIHEALANSYNVPAVKALEFIGLQEFYSFLLHDLGFIPIQDLDAYQYGIALGGLETDLLTLTHLFSIFPNKGVLKPLSVFLEGAGSTTISLPPRSVVRESRRVADPRHTELITAILSDRYAGAEQFGISGNLDLSRDGYAVKTGTSRDYHDSWVVGYTPDFVVGVWIGNSDNTPLDAVSGSSGAGAVWRDVMETLFASPYATGASFDRSAVAEILIDGHVEYGLPDDDTMAARAMLQSDALLLAPHDGDIYELTPGLSIPLISSEAADWYADGAFLGRGREIRFRPVRAGSYQLRAVGAEKEETAEISVASPTER